MSRFHFDYTYHLDELVPLFKELEALELMSKKKVLQVIKRHQRSDGNLFSKDQLVRAYRKLAGTHGLKPLTGLVLDALKMKPTRTISGVTPVTVLTKPFPCPGKCIFCPSDVRMPKSYLSDEPGAQRAERNLFDPYLQTYNRLQALYNIGHSINKAELIILGGTWSYYPEAYQIWFIKECFRALNEFGSKDSRSVVQDHYKAMQRKLLKMGAHGPSDNPDKNKKSLHKHTIDGDTSNESYNQVVSKVYTAPEKLGGFDKYQVSTWDELEKEQKINEKADSRCVGLVIETRPDNISPEEVIRVRRLGCTKTQIGFQSLDDDVLRKNKRGHDVAATRKAVRLLRLAGFKIHAHWMANLHGSSVEADKKDYDKLFSDKDFRPDELKIYPCSLIQSAQLMSYYKNGKWKPYTHDELLDVVSHCLEHTPAYCRLTRVIRDIPSPDIVAGNKKTNFRQIAKQHLDKTGKKESDIRSREIRGRSFDKDAVFLEEVKYKTSIGDEVFIQALADVKDERALIGFLRLSLPKEKPFIKELVGSALLREVHVYGRAVGVAKKSDGKPQHQGVGKQLIERAKELSCQAGYENLAVISAVGTREYYRKLGFTDGELYQFLGVENIPCSV